MREPSISQYRSEIERLYANSEVIPEDYDGATPETALHSPSLDDSTRLVRHHVRAVTGWESLTDDEIFFDRGMDSLQGLQLVRALRGAFHRHDFALSTVYQNPTVSQLTRAIVHRNDDNAQDERKVMQTLLDTYRRLIQQIEIPKSSVIYDDKGSKTVNVMLTGSTGTIGTHLLRALLRNDGVGRVFCVNRGEDGGQASQYSGFIDNGYDPGALDNRVTFIKADLQQPLLGLYHPTYESLRKQVGLIVHAAWPVNFNLALSAFRPQFAAVVNLLAFAANASSKFVFVSSVAAVGGSASGPPREEVLEDFDIPSPFGYGRAKFIAEVLVDTAAQHFKGLLPTAILRVGQVAGPVNRHDAGLWNPKEWFPSMVLSSLHLGQVPDNLGPFDEIDFIPVDILADVVVQLATAAASTEGISDRATVFNIRNPHPTRWKELLPAIVNAGGSPPQVVLPETWLAALRASVDADYDDDDVSQINPAVKLIGFFSRLWTAESSDLSAQEKSNRMSIDRALAESVHLRELKPVGLAWMNKWVGQWVKIRDG